MNDLKNLKIGSKIWLTEEKRPYRVRARSKRYLVCTKPHNPLHTVLYTVIDLDEQIRGTENLIFGAGAETDEDCKEMIDRLEGRIDHPNFNKTEISRRNRIPLNISKIKE